MGTAIHNVKPEEAQQDMEGTQWIAAKSGNLPKEGLHCLFKLQPKAPYRYEFKADTRNQGRYKAAGSFILPITVYGYRYGKSRVYIPLYFVSVSTGVIDEWKPSGFPDYYNGTGREGEEDRLIID